jgi:hypothetical protein
VIDGQMGASYPVRQWRHPDKGVVGHHTITVFGRGNTALTVPMPEYKIKDCQEMRIVNLDRRLRPNTQSEFDFMANIVTPVAVTANPSQSQTPPKAFVPASWVWSFGDGQHATTTVPAVTHDYESRPQTSLYSYFVVGVEIHGRDGSVLSGRTSLALINPAFEALAVKKIVVLMISLNPRFPVLGDDGTVSQSVKLWHHHPAPVTIDQILVLDHYRGGSGQSPPQSVDVASVLGQTTVPPGPDGLVAKLTLDINRDPDVLSRNYRLNGHTEDGFPVGGSFSIMQPPPRPTAHNSVVIDDALMKAKILAARSILQKDVVSDEDIWQLEREGKLTGLGQKAANPAESLSHGRPSRRAPTPPAQSAPFPAQSTPTTNPGK